MATMTVETVGVSRNGREPGRGKEASDVALVAAVLAGDTGAFEVLMRRYNRVLFRTARAILHHDADAEEAVQEAYLKAYLNLGNFAGDARLSTWLVKIAVNESLGRLRRRMPGGALDERAEWKMTADVPAAAPSPEAAAAHSELRSLLEAAIDALPQAQRTVFMLRAVEEFTTEDTAECLGIPPDTVKTRLHRAKRQLRRSLQRRADSALCDTFPFAGARCDRIVARVLLRLGLMPPGG